MKSKLITVNKKHIPDAKIGDMLKTTIHPDVVTTLYNANKITNIQKNGIIRVECINPKCKKKACTYLSLTERELKNLKIDNTIKQSGRLGGITI
ncbi:MAG: hypothetical protein E6R13_07210 [Spirochaetes bacterium]|nr:MAG: hypothetical protein E6R13_07210 [Spirochaetota bacterium]